MSADFWMGFSAGLAFLIVVLSAFAAYCRTLERELAAERARMADLVADLNDACDKELECERAKVRTLREACESICEEWGCNHNVPFLAGSNMEKHATAALAATEDAQ